jgi:DNA-binding NarL/FixJ family response regulator
VALPSSIPDAGSAERPRVLLADDHPEMLALIGTVLGSEYYVVGSVVDGLALLAEAERLNPDVIVLDVTMPVLDGIGAAHRLRHSRHPARLVFLTVHDRREFARAAIDAGGLGYVVKTRLASDLVPAIRAALADRRFISPTISLGENT